MEGITLVHLISASATLILMIGLGIYSGRKVSGAADFDTGGGRAGAIMVAGTIIGTLVGGSSTIGTAELAFNFGFSAWWFTLGAAIGCLILAVFFVVPLRNCGCATIQQLIQKHFSPTAGLITSVLATLGLGLNIVSQLLSANVLLSSMFGLNTLTCTAISVVTMACYVIFGGVNSTGLLGIVKSVLLYIAVLVCGGAALVLSGGIGSIQAVLPHDQYFNLFARGVGKDLGAGVSVILGVISTQTYVQALLAGRDSASSRRGALLSALLIPPIGVGGILIGYYMRISFPAMAAGEAFPRFVIQNIPPVLSGVVLATLFIAVVGTGAGLALGLSTVITNNIYKRFAKHTDSRSSLRFSRAVILITLLIAAVFTTGNLKSAILTWGFLSMGLRAVVLLGPMCAALFFPSQADRRFVTASSIVGIVILLSAKFLALPGDCLFWGMGGSILIIALGCLVPTSQYKSIDKS